MSGSRLTSSARCAMVKPGWSLRGDSYGVRCSAPHSIGKPTRMEAIMSSSFVLVLLAGLAGAAENYPRPELLREPAELIKGEIAKATRVLDARSKTKCQTG